MKQDHFKYVFWYIVGITMFGMFLTIFIIMVFPKTEASRFADQALIFWLTGGVGGCIGYLIGSSMEKTKQRETTGKTTAEISGTIVTEPGEETK